jgi:hypothetical protein
MQSKNKQFLQQEKLFLLWEHQFRVIMQNSIKIRQPWLKIRHGMTSKYQLH